MYEINYSIQKKKIENTKYSLKHNEQDSQLFIFEIIMKTLDGNNIILRKIKKNTQGKLFTSEESIKYANIDKIQVSVLNSNNLKNEIVSNVVINHNTSCTTYYTQQIYLEFTSNVSKFLECNYSILS
jgi:5'-3' exonuclease